MFSGTNLTLLIITFVFLLNTSLCTDDYELMRRIQLQQERQVRSQQPNVNNWDGLFGIESAANHLYLTARNGHGSMGPVIMKEWLHTASQMWTATKYDTSRGYNLKPLTNDFNIVTSSLNNDAHTYNVWEFKNPPPLRKSQFLIFNTLQIRCLQTSNSTQWVKFEKCQPANPLQHWILHKID